MKGVPVDPLRRLKMDACVEARAASDVCRHVRASHACHFRVKARTFRVTTMGRVWESKEGRILYGATMLRSCRFSAKASMSGPILYEVTARELAVALSEYIPFMSGWVGGRSDFRGTVDTRTRAQSDEQMSLLKSRLGRFAATYERPILVAIEVRQTLFVRRR